MAVILVFELGTWREFIVLEIVASSTFKKKQKTVLDRILNFLLLTLHGPSERKSRMNWLETCMELS